VTTDTTETGGNPINASRLAQARSAVPKKTVRIGGMTDSEREKQR
jgi:hypothetical protein